jgi:hypothetical protein
MPPQGRDVLVAVNQGCCQTGGPHTGLHFTRYGDVLCGVCDEAVLFCASWVREGWMSEDTNAWAQGTESEYLLTGEWIPLHAALRNGNLAMLFVREELPAWIA